MRKTLFGAVLVAGALSAVPSYARERGRDADAYPPAPNQVVDIADARIAQLKADLRLTADQDKNWGSFASALHDMAQRRADRVTKMREQRSSQSDPNAAPAATAAANDPNARRDDRDARARDDRDARGRDARDDRSPDLPTDLRRQADALTNKADDLRKFADAAGPLYSSLDDAQRRKFLGFTQASIKDDPDGAMGRLGPR